MNICYRLAEPTDLEVLVQLRILMQTEVNGVDESKVTAKYRQRVREYFSESIKNKIYFAVVAVDGNQIIGNAGVCFYEKPPSISGGFGKQGYVTNVYTMKSHRGRGIGTEMMKRLSELAVEQKADRLHLGATEDGVSIYKAVGYDFSRHPYLEINFPAVKAL